MPMAARIDRDRARDVARTDMALGLTSLFRALPDGARRHEVTLQQPWCGGLIIIQGVECSATDQAVLFALLALAGQHDPLPEPAAPAIDNGLMAAGAAVERGVMRFNTSSAALMREAGMDPNSHGSRATIRASIRRLAGIVIEGRHGNDWATTHLIAGAAGRGRDAISVVLSYRLSEALIGACSYARIEMSAYRALNSGVARIAYSWLCSWYAAATGTRQIGIDALELHAYGGVAAAKSTRSERRAALRAALGEIGTLPSWAVTDGASGAITITRRTRTRTQTGLAPNPNRPSAEPADG